MSELVRKIHALKREVFDLEQEIISWKSKYASEVNHSEELNNGLISTHLPCSKAICAFCDIIDEHEQRRQDDLGLSISNPESPDDQIQT